MKKQINKDGNAINFNILKDEDKTFLEAVYTHAWHDDDYVFMPAACYNGNRFAALKKAYPPMFASSEAAVDMPTVITDVPRLEKDGSGSIELTTGDVSVPCIGVFSKHEKKGILLFTVQQISGINLGLSYSKAKLAITYPAKRQSIYRWPFMTDEKDKGIDFKAGRIVQIPYMLFEFACESIEEFYSVFLKKRKCMGLSSKGAENLPISKLFNIQKDKFNRMNWQAIGGFYGVAVGAPEGQVWQPGWVGGAISSYALMKLGGKTEQERALKTLEHLFRTQAASGFFYESTDGYGAIGSSFHQGTAAEWCLIRKSADVLYFLFKHFDVMKENGLEIPENFILGTQKLADAFARLWEKYGQFGQFIHLHTGDIAVGGSASGGIIPAGLVKAALYFNNSKYLNVAEKSAEAYYANFLSKGYTTGGPGEILQCPDSESAFAILESYAVLYEETRNEKWLKYARHAANIAASWVMAYNYEFPQESEFARLRMKTCGTVFANLQNKHSAPGICTFSGDSLYKLYLWTQDASYLELIQDIALSISQYMSTEERPIYSWALPKDPSLDENKGENCESEKLPQGFICERVNTSDWEGSACVGGVFNGSCWPETSLLLTLAELAPIFSNKLKDI